MRAKVHNNKQSKPLTKVAKVAMLMRPTASDINPTAGRPTIWPIFMTAVTIEPWLKVNPTLRPYVASENQMTMNPITLKKLQPRYNHISYRVQRRRIV